MSTSSSLDELPEKTFNWCHMFEFTERTNSQLVKAIVWSKWSEIDTKEVTSGCVLRRRMETSEIE